MQSTVAEFSAFKKRYKIDKSMAGVSSQPGYGN